ncbi:hypothetical protein LV83_01853 [Algoriphagus yeomjeoni]|uniref:Uncharacterized protein n=1 Tax=Algoriphagus yeomjeoni TaxID=291403 RepID=A0A327PKG5_9BACT|nr:hypothetical protein LV83_01853 [Algoriphagus yeomjeoni]
MINFNLNQYFKIKGIEQVINVIFPLISLSDHVSERKRSKSWFYIISGTFYLLIKLFFLRKKKLSINKNYDVLLFAPNLKYRRFVDAITNNVSFSYLVLSEESYDNDVFTVDDFKLFKSKNYVFTLLFRLINIYLSSYKSSQLNSFKINYWNILSLTRRDLTAKLLFNEVKFNNYFSFHPVEGYHQIIQNFYKTYFKNTYAIRPTTTTFSKEHQFIKTDNLFFKTDLEYKIYQHYILDSVNLIKGGIIAEPKEINKKVNTKGVLFLDTCTNINFESIAIRRKAISHFIEFSKHSKLNVYYKFHPGLINKERIFTEKIILENSRFKVIEDDIPWESISVALGFDTTLFYDCFLHRVPVLSFRKEYSLFVNLDSEFSSSPVIPISKKTDFEIIDKLNRSNSLWHEINDEQYFWFSKQYNFPEGLLIIKQILND